MLKKILICGATGFVGRNMVNYFSKKAGFEIHAVNYTRAPFEANNVKWHKVDLRNPAELEKLFSIGFDYIIQAAATTSGSKDIVTRPYIHTTDNAVMNSYIFRLAFEKKVKHVIFFSCTVMYQSSEKALKESDFNESDPLHPRYFGVGNTKIYCEKMCQFYGELSKQGKGETKYTAIRHSNIYGEYDKYDLERSHFFGANVTKIMIEKSDKLTIWGTGEEKRDLLHANDLCEFVELAMQKQGDFYRLYNCGLGEAHSVKSVVQAMIKHSGKNLKIEHDLSQPTIPTSLFVDCTLAKNELGWSPKIPLDDGIKRTMQWWKNNINPQTLMLKS
jgi:GDP-L-fucose synthase